MQYKKTFNETFDGHDSFAYPFYLPFKGHVHCFDSSHCLLRRFKAGISHCMTILPLYSPVILLNDFVKIFRLSQICLFE